MKLAEHVTAQLESSDQVVAYCENTVQLTNGSEGIQVYVADDPSSVPSAFDGLPVEIEMVGHNEYQAQMTACTDIDSEKLFGGGGICYLATGDQMLPGGTLGYFVNVGDKKCLLSAGHVLEAVGGLVFRAQLLGGEDDGRSVATVIKSVRSASKGVDAAVAELKKGVKYQITLEEVGKISGKKDVSPKENTDVQSYGFASQHIDGRVSRTGVSVKIGGKLFKKQTFVFKYPVGPAGRKPFTQKGDSGSLVVLKKPNPAGSFDPIGLVMGANDHYTSVNPIGDVLATLGAEIMQ